MKKFQFRLQKVKEVKERYEKQRMLDLAKAKKIVYLETEKLNLLKEKTKACYQNIEDKKADETVKPGEMTNYFRYLNKLKNDIADQKNVIQNAEHKMEAKRKVLIEATQERKILDMLKDKKKEVFKVELSRKEQFVLDDLASNKYSRERVDS